MRRFGGKQSQGLLSFPPERSFGSTGSLQAVRAHSPGVRERCENKTSDMLRPSYQGLSPLDEDAILGSVQKTNRLIVIDEANPRCSIATDIAALVADKGFDSLDAPIKRITAPHTPVPFSPVLEDLYLPTPKTVIQVVSELLGDKSLLSV